MTEAKHVWNTVASTDAVGTEAPLEVVVGNALVILVRTGDGIAAFQGNCPHQFARLGGGMIVDGRIRCPHHRADFSLTDGTCGPGWILPALKRYAVRVEDGQVLLPDPLIEL